jgi:glutamate-1-semialdehyde 2,1-aminomutase
MNCIAPDGPVYQAGTLSGNPLAMVAGIATLKILQKNGFYEQLEEKSAGYAERLKNIAGSVGIDVQLNRVGSMMTGFFTAEPVTDFESAMKADAARYAQHYRQMLAGGVYLAPSQFETAFISAAQTEEDLLTAIKITEWSFKKLLEK